MTNYESPNKAKLKMLRVVQTRTNFFPDPACTQIKGPHIAQLHHWLSTFLSHKRIKGTCVRAPILRRILMIEREYTVRIVLNSNDRMSTFKKPTI